MNWIWLSKQRGDALASPLCLSGLDVLLILHADHEQNCSANAMRSVARSEADPYSAAARATAALFGPLDGGANQQVLHMLRQIGSNWRTTFSSSGS